MADRLIMIGINLLLSAALWGIGLLLRRPTHTVQGEIKDKEIQISSYGAPKPIIYGQCKIAMSLIFATKLQPHAITHEVGKGGGDTVTEYYYTCDHAGIFGIAPDQAIFGQLQLLKLWHDHKLVFNATGDNDKPKQWINFPKRFKFYPGSSTQLPDPTMEARLGAGNVPGYRYKCYGMYNNHNVTPSGNRIPTVRALVAPGVAAAPGVYPVTGFTVDATYADQYGENSVLGAVVTKNEMHIITYNTYDAGDGNDPYTKFRKVSTYNRNVVTERVYEGSYPSTVIDYGGVLGSVTCDTDCDGGAIPFHYWACLDVDELDRVYVATCDGGGQVARMDSTTFTIEAVGPVCADDGSDANNTWVKKVKVSRNPIYPYLWVIKSAIEYGSLGYQSLWLLNRETLANPADSSAFGQEFLPPDGDPSTASPYAIASSCVDHADGSLWAMWLNRSPGIEAILVKNYPDGRQVKYDLTSALGITSETYHSLCFDPDSDQVIYGGYDGQHKIWFIDADDGSINGFLVHDFEGAYGSVAAWHRGVVDGYLYMPSGWEGSVVQIDVRSREIVNTYDFSSSVYDYANDGGGMHLGPLFINYKGSVFVAARNLAGTIDMQEVLLGRFTEGTVTLDDVVADICKRGGLTDGQINVANLAGIEVKGYCIHEDQSIREALEPLMEAFIFDFAEIDGVLTAIRRGGPVVATIPEDDLASFKFGGTRPEPLEIEGKDEVGELPRRVEVYYDDINRKHEDGVQHYQRQATDSKLIRKIQTPVLFDEDDAKQLAHISFRYDWNTRECKLSLGPKWARLSPCDVVKVEKTEGNYRVVLLESQKEGLLTNWTGVVEEFDYETVISWQGEWGSSTTYSANDAVIYDGQWYVSLQDNNLDKEPTVDSDWESWWELYAIEGPYDSDEEGNPLPVPDEDVDFPGPSIYYLLDTPPLMDSHDLAGIYLASGALFDGWSGCQVWVSKDEATTWSLLKSIPQRSVTGVALTALNDHSSVVRDRHSTLTVRWDYDDDALSSVTESQLLQGQGNYLAIVKLDGDVEVICAKTVVTNGDGTQSFTNIIRGVKGTDYAMTGHVVGEKVVKLDINTVVLASLDETYLNQSYLYHGVSSGDDWEDGARKVFETTLNTLVPWSGVQPRGARDGSNNLTITWKRRNRIFGLNELFTGNEIPMSESSEAYEIDVYDNGNIVRTITGLSSESASYTAAQQTADGLTPGDPVHVKIYQVSSEVSRGRPLDATI